MDFEAIRVDTFPIDAQLVDASEVGPDLSAAAHAYLATPRALVWRNPSPDWKLFVLLLPLASRLSLMANPIFGQLTRDWGHSIRFVGVDRHQLAYDFRSLLSDATLRRLVGALARWLHEADRREDLPARAAEAATLDVLFAALGENVLTILEARRDDWGRHLAREHRLEPGVPRSLFDRASRYPDFLALLRRSLRLELVDVEFYGKVLRSMDLREATAEQRAGAMIEASLDPVVLVKLGRTRAGRHLGCYNWLATGPRHAAQRAYVLGKLPAFAQLFADLLVDAAPRRRSGLVAAAEHDPRHSPRREADTTEALRQAVDSGQDRWVVEALASHFGVQHNVIRALWRHCPAALDAPPVWHLRQILLRLDELPERAWPRDDAGWLELASRSVPAVAG
ncbi:MAG TPA: hypothetical protein VEA81_11720 [Burkholderiaceae bacterium]|nr:hypothetical protein [Burkholderiaceae bacterium]